MITKISNGSQQTILQGSIVTFDPSVLTPNGPFNVVSVNEQAMTFQCDGANVVGTDLTANSLIDVDNSAIPQQIVSFGNGVQALMFSDAAALVSSLQAAEAALAQQVQDLESGAAIAPLQAQITQLTASNLALQNEINSVVQLWPVGVGATLQKIETLLIPPKQ